MARSERPKKMLAWTLQGFGGIEQLEFREVIVPKPAPTDVLIKMYGAEVGTWDSLEIAGRWPPQRRFPVIPGLAGAGEIAAAGERAGAITEGDKVLVFNYPLEHQGCPSQEHNGAWAEYMLAPSARIAPAPKSLDLVRAGSVPVLGTTAHEMIYDILKVHPDDVVLITGAASGVGHLALQMAVRLGAHVLAVTDSANIEFVRQLGAKHVIDSTQVKSVVEAVRRHCPEGVDKILNCLNVDSAEEILLSLAPTGRMADLTGTLSKTLPDVRAVGGYVPLPDAKRLGKITQLIDDGALRVDVQKVFLFDRAPEALEHALSHQDRGSFGVQVIAEA